MEDKADFKKILERLEHANVKKVKVAVADIDGVLRGKYLHFDKFAAAADSGFGFCNVVLGWDSADVCYDNVKYTGWHSGYPDQLVQLDPATERNVPWDNNVPFFLGHFVKSDLSPLDICPRQTLRRVIERAEAMGFTAKNGMEFEWFNFRETAQSLDEKGYIRPEPITPGMFGYSLIRAGQERDYFNALMDELTAFGVPIEGLHTETGPGVYEAAILYSGALESADRATLFKAGAKDIAARFGIMPSFMAKWNASLPGCSGHMHQSLWNANGENAFYDAAEAHRMSSTFKSYLAGQLKLLPELLPFFAPTVNSYKRLVDGYWAPVKPTWGIDNRTVSHRVIPGSEKSTRLEVRVSGSDVNPYLSVAASLAAGLYGIENKLKLEDAPVKGSAYTESSVPRLPHNLLDATRRLADSKVAREILGADLVEHFVATREWEWRQFQDAVTNWETRRYFEII
ncbi:MAG TPA: glutamine synthetase family protein [Turneriella sp.]|nr:glutamine synthetase family protein [Turneriella sp.]HNN01023.1 glutamine synthetase family protein [Turneriella sp.]